MRCDGAIVGCLLLGTVDLRQSLLSVSKIYRNNNTSLEDVTNVTNVTTAPTLAYFMTPVTRGQRTLPPVSIATVRCR